MTCVAQGYEQLKQYKEAKDMYEIIISVEPDNSKAHEQIDAL